MKPPLKKGLRASISLKYMMVFVAVAGVLCYATLRVKRKVDAVQKIVKAGGTIKYDFEYFHTSPKEPGFLAKWLPREVFHDVVEIDIDDNNFDDFQLLARFENLQDLRIISPKIKSEDLKYIASLRHLRVLLLNSGITEGIDEIRSSNINNSGIVKLQALTNLEELFLRYTDIDDDALAALSNQAPLKRLHLQYTRVGNVGLSHLRKFNKLQDLDLTGTLIDDRGLHHLEELVQLKHLCLSSTRIGNNSVKSIAHLSQLRTLILSYTDIDDEGLTYLKPLEHLDFLSLSDTQIGDAGLVNLRSLSRLEILSLSNTNITNEGLKALKSLKELKDIDISNTHTDWNFANTIFGNRSVRLQHD